MSKKLTQERLKELLHYDPETGVFTWLNPPGTKVQPGAQVGETANTEYKMVGIDRKVYFLHRLAWLYMTGEEPPPLIDHKDRNKRNNRWDNLVESDKSRNGHNANVSISNTSGYTGVSWCAYTSRWRATITVRNKALKLGRFDTPEEAHQAYLAAKARLHTFQPTPRATSQATL